MNQRFIIVVLAQLALLINGQRPASKLLSVDICAGKSVTLSCKGYSLSHMIFIVDAYHGVQQSSSSASCGFQPGDCTEELTINVCKSDSNTCNLFASSNRKLNKCGRKKANYLHIEYRCVPFELLAQDSNDICATKTVTTSKGVIESPKYPGVASSNICKTEILTDVGKSVSIWLVDMDMYIRDNNGNCNQDYVSIGDSTGDFVHCAKERASYVKTFCSNRVYIDFKTSNKKSNNKRFKIYYETYDTTSLSGCPGNPNLPDLTTKIPTTSPQMPTELQNNQASSTYDFQICKGDPKQVITAPEYFTIYFEKLIYGLSPSLTCEEYLTTHCTQPSPITCNLKTSCNLFPPQINKLELCGNQLAQYTYGEYRYIPIDSKTKFEMSDNSNIDADNNQYGVITSRNYPKWEQYADFTRKIASRNPNKVIRFYITDIDIEDPTNFDYECQTGFLELTDGLYTKRFCGITNAQDSFEFIGCSNELTLTYQTGAGGNYLDSIYRGFRAYYELIDIPNTCGNVLTTTNAPTTEYVPPVYPGTTDIFSSVLATTSLLEVKPCYFPFEYNGQQYNKCAKDGSSDEYWCSTTKDYNKDKQKATCNKGFTQNVKFYICKGGRQQFTCPVGYLIDIVSSEMIVTSDNSCNPNKRTCTESNLKLQKQICNGKNSCFSFANSYQRLESCSNKIANIVQIDYQCIPDEVEYIKPKEFCNIDHQEISDESGIIETIDYPSKQKNIDCTIQYKNKDKRTKLISIYSVSTDLENTWIDNKCDLAYFTINGGEKRCKRLKPELLAEFCSDSFNIKIKIGSEAYGGGRFYYETEDIIDESLCPGGGILTTKNPSSTVITTTKEPISTPKPIYAQQGIASPTTSLDLCSGSKTFQCPAGYVIAIRKSFYGYSSLNNCFYSPSDCVSYREVDGLDKCRGANTCYLDYTTQKLAECDYKQSSYIQVEYDCVPNTLTKQNLCSQNFFAKQGLISTPNYPQFETNLDCSTKITVGADKLIKAYIMDMSLGEDCSAESVTFSDDGSYIKNQYCGQVKTRFAIQTCSNTLTVNVKTKENEPSIQKTGVSIYYEEIPNPGNLDCPKPSTTTRLTTTTTKKTTKLTTTVSPFLGFLSGLYSVTGCGSSQTLSCPTDYIIHVESSVFGVRTQPSSICSDNPYDCQAGSYHMDYCAGKSKCTIDDFKLNSEPVPECGNKFADYFHIVYRCVPTKNAGNPPKNNIELCRTNDGTSFIDSKSSAVIQNPNYPGYPSDSTFNCVKNITTNPGSHLQLYINSVRLQAVPGNLNNCSAQTKNYLIVSDGFISRKFCRTVKTQFVFESRSNWITIESNLERRQSQSSYYKGFQLYAQGYTNIMTTPAGFTTTTVTRKPVKPGFASSTYHGDICSDTQAELKCRPTYGIIIRSESLIHTGTGCSHSELECKQQSSVLYKECSMKQTCPFYFGDTEISGCGASTYADILHYDYQCVPTKATDTAKEYTCGDGPIQDAEHGFVKSPKYPGYEINKECDLEITPPVGYAVRFYMLDLALSSDDCSTDSLRIDGQSFCGNNGARYAYKTINSDTIKIAYQSEKTSSRLGLKASGLDNRGFRLYFETYSLAAPTTIAPIIPTTTQFLYNAVRDNGETGDLNKVTFLAGIPILAILVFLVLFVYKRGRGDNGNSEMRIKYNKDNEATIADDIHSFANPLSS